MLLALALAAASVLAHSGGSGPSLPLARPRGLPPLSRSETAAAAVKADDVAVTLHLAAAQSRTSRKIHGVAIDTFSLMHMLNFSDPALRQPAAALAPALLRVGGSAQRSYPVCFGSDHLEPANATCLTRGYWASLCEFASAINTSLIYGLHNDAVGNMELLASVIANRSACPALAGFSIGNEGVPVRAHKTPEQFRVPKQRVSQDRLRPSVRLTSQLLLK